MDNFEPTQSVVVSSGAKHRHAFPRGEGAPVRKLGRMRNAGNKPMFIAHL